MVNSNLLKGAIVSAGYTQRTLAPLIEMSENTLGKKINNVRPFDTDEVTKICDIIHITEPADKCAIFLA